MLKRVHREGENPHREAEVSIWAVKGGFIIVGTTIKRGLTSAD